MIDNLGDVIYVSKYNDLDFIFYVTNVRFKKHILERFDYYFNSINDEWVVMGKNSVKSICILNKIKSILMLSDTTWLYCYGPYVQCEYKEKENHIIRIFISKDFFKVRIINEITSEHEIFIDDYFNSNPQKTN
jgi:hypothetical protein